MTGYHVYALDVNGTLWGLCNDGWARSTPHTFMTLAYARCVTSRMRLPQHAEIIDAYCWSTEHETSFALHLATLCLAPEAMVMIEAGEICYENAEILNRLTNIRRQKQFLSEARDFTPKEFAQVIRGAIRRLTTRKNGV